MAIVRHIKKIDTQKLIHYPEIKTKYKEKLEEKLNNQVDKTWKNLSKVITETACKRRDRPHKIKN